MITAILLIPAKDDPHGLLAKGVCGGRVPMLYERPPSTYYGGHGSKPADHPWVLAGTLVVLGGERHHARRALVLAWDSTVTVEGCDRAGRVLGTVVLSELWLASRPTMDDVMRLATVCAARLGGEVVTLTTTEKP